MEKVNLAKKLALVKEYWNPKIIGEFNDSFIKAAKLEGEFVWHHHEHEDEMFFVVKGHLVIRLRDRDIHLSDGEFFIIPKGVEHLPIAEDEVHVMLIEPKATLNTGNMKNERTVEKLDWI